MSYKNSHICMKVIAFLGFLLLFQPSFAQSDFSDLESNLQRKQKELGKDFVVMIWKKDDTLVYKKDFGQFNSKTQAPLASSSKLITAVMVMMLVEEGKISLDDKITRWLPEFEKYGKNYITIRHCLTHFTGIKAEASAVAKFFYQKKYSSIEDEVNSFAAKDIQRNPGEEFRYSDLGISIAGRILEIVSKKKFDILARQKLFVPLGMRKTTFSTLDGSALNPSLGAMTTGDDFMIFLRMLLNKGIYRDKRILSEESVNELLKVQTLPELMKYSPKAVQGYSYASGAWVMNEKDGSASALAAPSLFGTWPIIDYCHGYAYLLLVKEPTDEEKANTQTVLKELVDQQFNSNCK